MGRTARHTLRLPDGRSIAYVVDGTPDAKSTFLFMFHGMFSQGSRYVPKKPYQNVVLVCPDRPGWGGSSSAPAGWSYKQFAQDIAAVAKKLKADKFIVAGHSSGGPCAMACAAHLPDQVLACGLISTDAEYAQPDAPDDPGPGLAPCGSGPMGLWCVGCAVNASSQGGSIFLGGNGFRTDFLLERQLYDFRLGDIDCPTVVVVGSKDEVEVARSRWVHSKLQEGRNSAKHFPDLKVMPQATRMNIVEPRFMHDIIQSFVLTATKITRL